jgi:hypothetical protein
MNYLKKQQRDWWKRVHQHQEEAKRREELKMKPKKEPLLSMETLIISFIIMLFVLFLLEVWNILWPL